MTAGSGVRCIVAASGRRVAFPAPRGRRDLRAALSAEHEIDLGEPNDLPRIGDKLELIVGCSDTTLHLHEEIVAVRNGRIEAWPIGGADKQAVADHARHHAYC